MPYLFVYPTHISLVVPVMGDSACGWTGEWRGEEAEEIGGRDRVGAEDLVQVFDLAGLGVGESTEGANAVEREGMG